MADIDSALPIGGIYEATPTTYTDGDNGIPVLVDANGRLQVDVVSGGGSNASVVVDDSAFTVGTGSITAIGGIATSDSVDAGDAGAFRMLTNRALVTTLESAAGNGIVIDGSGYVTANINGTVTVDANGSDVTIDNAAGAAAVNIQDGGNSITVDGTVAATQSGTWDIGTLTSITNDVNIADGGNSITVDAVDLDIRNLNLTDDAVKVSGNATANSETNPIFVQNVSGVLSGIEVVDYDTSASVAKDATDNHDYAVAASNTLKVQCCLGSASGAQKIEIQSGPVASLVTKAVVFTSSANPNWVVDFKGLLEVDDASTGTLRIARTNRDNQAMDVYSTVLGSLIAD